MEKNRWALSGKVLGGGSLELTPMKEGGKRFSHLQKPGGKDIFEQKADEKCPERWRKKKSSSF